MKVLFIPNPLNSSYLRYLLEVLYKTLELLVLSALGGQASMASVSLQIPREAGGSPPSTFMVKLFSLQLLVFLLGLHLVQEQAAPCLSHKRGFGFAGRWSSKPFTTAGLPLRCPWKLASL